MSLLVLYFQTFKSKADKGSPRGLPRTKLVSHGVAPTGRAAWLFCNDHRVAPCVIRRTHAPPPRVTMKPRLVSSILGSRSARCPVVWIHELAHSPEHPKRGQSRFVNVPRAQGTTLERSEYTPHIRTSDDNSRVMKELGTRTLETRWNVLGTRCLAGAGSRKSYPESYRLDDS